MVALLHAEHGEFAFVPAGHEIEPETARADMIGGDKLLGGNQRMKQWGVHGPEDRDAPCCCEQAARPGDGLKRRAVKVARAAIALPASDRQQEIDACLIR